MTVDEALNIAVIHALSIKHGIAVSEAAEAASILAAEVRLLRDEVNGLTGSLDRAEKALKEAQEQEPVAFWWIGPDGKDNGGPYRGKPSDAAIDNARNMGCEPVLLYARPVAAAPTVAVPAVPEEWREVLRECADDLAIELDMRYGDSRKYPSEQRKYEAEMQPVYRARSLLQSADHSELAIEKVAPDCRACANRGRINGLSQEFYCDSCIYQGRDWRKNHFVDVSKMVDEVNRRCEACAILPCSCK